MHNRFGLSVTVWSTHNVRVDDDDDDRMMRMMTIVAVTVFAVFELMIVFQDFNQIF